MHRVPQSTEPLFIFLQKTFEYQKTRVGLRHGFKIKDDCQGIKAQSAIILRQYIQVAISLHDYDKVIIAYVLNMTLYFKSY